MTYHLPADRIRELRAAGRNWTQIARVLGVSRCCVENWRKRNGWPFLPVPPRRNRPPAVPDPDVATAALLAGRRYEDAIVRSVALTRLASPAEDRSLTGCAAAECTR